MGVDGGDERVPSPGRRDLTYDDIELGDPIGRGGNADVTAARLGDGTRVALKEPRFQGTLRTETVEAFLEEAETWETIDDHAHVVGLVDWGGSPMPWIAMEYMDGGSLADRLADGPLSVADVVRVGGATCRAVRHAHRHGLVHLDLKPANVLFREITDGPDVAKVGDWGLARFLAEHSGSIEGLSPQYAAPEQFDAETYGPPDDFTDIYQVGAVVYEALTGRPPFEGSGVAVMHSILDEEPDPPTTVDPSLSSAIDEVLLRALATEKADRYETVVDLRRALEELSGDGDRTATGLKERLLGVPSDDTDDNQAVIHERVEGALEFYDEDGGNGFIETDVTDESVYVHSDETWLEGAAEGDRVRFDIVEGDHSPRAVNLELVEDTTEPRTTVDGSSGGATGAGSDPDDRAEGVVDFYNDTGRYGFIETDAVDEDVFFHAADAGLDNVTEGDRLRFEVEQADKGPRAVNVESVGNDPGNDTTSAEPAPPQGRVRGVVDFFNDTGGYGFIEADAVDEDVFFHMEDIGGPDLEEGQEVEFAVEPREKGPVATDLMRL